MMKKVFAIMLVLLVLPVLCHAMAGSAPVKKAAYPYLLDNFDDGNFNKEPEWFSFDRIAPTIAKGSSGYYLNVTGTASDWYVGGMGTVLGIDASGYDTFELDVSGSADNPGILKIELYDDDNGNADIEVDSAWKPIYDDLWTYELKVDKSGFQHASIPLSEFKNSGRGNGKFDPGLKNGSSGLTKVQLIFVANSQTGAVDFSIDNLELGLLKK